MQKDTLRQTANALSVLIALTVNVLAAALPLNGQNTGDISDRFPVYFVPAGYVFAIWSVIFIGWIAFALYQFQSAPAPVGISLRAQRTRQFTLAVLLAL